jgi:hypothetical protein
VSDQIFAISMQRQVYRSEEPQSDSLIASHSLSWSHYENGLFGSPFEIAGFDDLDGFSHNEIYVTGWRGELQIYEGGRWRPIEIPINLKLERLLAAPDGKVYLAGIRGVILTGRGDHFEIFPQTVTEESFWDICWAFDNLWLAGASVTSTLKCRK